MYGTTVRIFRNIPYFKTPGSPVSPRGPATPLGPGCPRLPCSPLPPLGPRTPGSPGAPRSPVLPGAPVNRCTRSEKWLMIINVMHHSIEVREILLGRVSCRETQSIENNIEWKLLFVIMFQNICRPSHWKFDFNGLWCCVRDFLSTPIHAVSKLNFWGSEFVTL